MGIFKGLAVALLTTAVGFGVGFGISNSQSKTKMENIKLTHQEEISDMHNALNESLAEKLLLEQTVESLNTELLNALNGLTYYSEQLELANGIITEKESQIITLQSEIDSLTIQLETATTNNEELQTQLTEKINLLNQAHSELETANNNMLNLQNQISALNNQIAELQASLQDYQYLEDYINNVSTSATLFTFNEGTVTGYTGENPYVIIPQTYSLDSEGNVIDGTDIKVTTLSGTFSNNTTVKKVKFQNGIETVSSGSFYGCTNLNEVVLSNSVTSLSVNLFERCTNLKTITLSKSLKELPRYLFRQCSSLQEVEIPEGVTTIADNCFEGCTVMSLVTLPSTLSTIGMNAFANCQSLKSIEIPDTVTSIGTGCFRMCNRLKSVKLSNNISIIPVYCFEKCYALTSIEIPEGVTEIGNNAFQGSYNISSVTLPSTLTTIGSMVFASNELKTLTIPQNVSSLAYNFMPNPMNLETLTIESKLLTDSEYVLNLGNANHVSILVPTEKLEEYKEYNYFSKYADRLFAYIDFTIEDNTFNCKEGKTWSDCIPIVLDSLDLNIDENGYVMKDNYYLCDTSTASLVLGSDLVRHNGHYVFRAEQIPVPGQDEEIQFTIDGIEYTATNDMTWFDWCNSGYSGDMYSVENVTEGNIIRLDTQTYIAINGVKVQATDLITNAEYISINDNLKTETITFSIFHEDENITHTYSATTGMTWNDWVASEYNTIGLVNGLETTIIDEVRSALLYEGNTIVKNTDLITSDGVYNLYLE